MRRRPDVWRDLPIREIGEADAVKAHYSLFVVQYICMRGSSIPRSRAGSGFPTDPADELPVNCHVMGSLVVIGVWSIQRSEYDYVFIKFYILTQQTHEPARLAWSLQAAFRPSVGSQHRHHPVGFRVSCSW